MNGEESIFDEGEHEFFTKEEGDTGCFFSSLMGMSEVSKSRVGTQENEDSRFFFSFNFCVVFVVSVLFWVFSKKLMDS